MFGTLRYNSVTKDVEHVELERADGFEARGYSKTACNECRTRKLKCSGEKGGCQRCRAISTTCIYQSNADKSPVRNHRQYTQSSSRYMSSSSGSVETEQTASSLSQKQAVDQIRPTRTQDAISDSSYPQISDSSAEPATPAELSWASSPTPLEDTDLGWAFPSDDLQHTMDISDPWLSYLDGSQMHNSITNEFIAPNAASESSSLEFRSLSKNTGFAPGDQSESRGTENTCQCVAIMLNLLENIGVYGLGGNYRETGAGLDDTLGSLARGMNVLECVLGCGQCNACTENGMLLAAIAQQLSATAASIARCFPSQEYPYGNHESTRGHRGHRANSKALPSSATRTMDFSKPVLGLPDNDSPSHNAPDLLEGAIFFGRYKIQNPEMQLQIVYHALLLHISQLREIFDRIKDRTVANRGARNLMLNEERNVAKLWDLFRSKVLY